MRKVFIITVLILGTVIYFIIKQELGEIPKKMEAYKPTEVVYFSDTTGLWEDNFDSSYYFNGCLTLTHKQQ